MRTSCGYTHTCIARHVAADACPSVRAARLLSIDARSKQLASLGPISSNSRQWQLLLRSVLPLMRVFGGGGGPLLARACNWLPGLLPATAGTRTPKLGCGGPVGLASSSSSAVLMTAAARSSPTHRRWWLGGVSGGSRR